MADELIVRVRLDTRQAQADLDALKQDGEETGEIIGSDVRKRIGKGLNALGVGAAIGAGYSAVRAATTSGVGDLFGESLGGISAQLNDFFLGTLDDEARASFAAREETKQAFAYMSSIRGEIPPQARTFFEQVKSVRLEEEKGRAMIDRDDFFRGPGIGALVESIFDRLGDLLSAAVDKLAEKLNPANWF